MAREFRRRIPSSPLYVERLGRKKFNEHLLPTLRHACRMIVAWRDDHNNERPHSSLAGLTPYEYATGPFDLRLTKMGSRSSCVSLAHRHFRGHAPHQIDKTPIGRWSISPRSRIFLSGCAFTQLQAAHGIRPISLTLRQNRPGNTCHLVGYGDCRDVHIRPPR